MAASLKHGDAVRWQTSQGDTSGTVEKVVTKETRMQGHVAKASKEKPQVVVKSDRSGKEAVHKPEALRKA